MTGHNIIVSDDPAKESGHAASLVVIGSSAGGIEALSVLLGRLPADFPAPIVLAQHLDPSRPSQLAGILKRRAKVQVVQVGGDTALQKGKVYVVPSNRHVLIRDGVVALSEDQAARPRPSIDLLLSTAARAYGERLIAVILTGSGSDGAAGALEVKEAGGTVIIQDPTTAAHPSMPLALPPTAVDHVAALEQIGSLMGHILQSSSSLHEREAVSADAMTEVLTRITRHSYIDFRQYKPSTILRRVGRRMAINRLRTIEEYETFLDGHPQEVTDLVRSLLIKVTEFFRDTEAFEFMEREVLPALIEQGRGRGRILRLWSAGCATGEEAYSLGLMVSNALGRELPEWTIKIFATDVDGESIAYARRGYYAASVVDGLPEEYRSRYFERSDHGYRVSKPLRQMVIFGQQDLSRGSPFPRIDLVVCRNLLIYFKPELQQQVLDLFAYSLHHNQGYLFLGKAEAARPAKSVYELVNKKWKVYRCVSGPLPLPGRSMNGAGMAPSSRAVQSEAGAPEEAVSRGTGPVDFGQLRRANELMLRHVPVAIAVIDRSYRIISVNPAARRLLGIHNATDQDFLHSARGLPYHEVRETIDRMFSEQVTVTLPEVDLGVGGAPERRHVGMHVVPFHIEGGPLEFGLVCMVDITELVLARRRFEEVQNEQKHLSDQLGALNWRLTVTNKELEDANEELQAGNEEMMLTQEELQATNEEFEATNEELQATNEELETNNEELQATNEELETTNDELQARSAELHDLTRALTGERQRLGIIVEHAPIHSALLRGATLGVEEMHPDLEWLLGQARATHLPFADVALDPALEPVRAGVMQAVQNNQVWIGPRMCVEHPAGERWYTFSAVPTTDLDGKVDGVVLYADDVTDRRRLEQEERLGDLRLMLDHADQVALGLLEMPDGRLVHASRRFQQLVELVTGGRSEHLTWSRLWPGNAPMVAALEEVMSTRQSRRVREVPISDGSVWDLSLIPILNEDGGEVRNIVASGIEVTDAVRTREHLEKVDQLKDEFLSLASHELRTPLAPLSAYAEVLRQMIGERHHGPNWDQQLQQITDSFQRQVAQMSRLTDDLLDVARLQSGRYTLKRERIDLRGIVQEAVDRARHVAERPAVRVDLDSVDGLPVVADEVRIGQAVHNLIVNALVHAADSPQIEVRVHTLERDGTRRARIEVRDYGPGVPEGARDRLFTRFQSVPHETRPTRSGLGLGLYISRQIVEQHGGTIGVEHEQTGSTFWIELPLA
jgi:chemotaxis methyl-accepting protein methylase/signal transduction histidine kinase